MTTLSSRRIFLCWPSRLGAISLLVLFGLTLGNALQDRNAASQLGWQKPVVLAQR